MITTMNKLLIAIPLLLLSGCLGYPDNITPVQDFELNKYLGKWYEIARLDHSFERELEKVTEEYSLRDDGGVRVINRGYSSLNNKWQEAEGKAYFVRDRNEAYLKVSFFGPFYGSYVVFTLEKNYDYAFVTSFDRSFLWLLSRTPQQSSDVKAQFIDRVQELGYNVDELIFVKHE